MWSDKKFGKRMFYHQKPSCREKPGCGGGVGSGHENHQNFAGKPSAYGLRFAFKISLTKVLPPNIFYFYSVYTRLSYILLVCLTNILSHIVFGKPMFCLPTSSCNEEPVCQCCACAVSTFLICQSTNLAHVLASIWPQFNNFQQKTSANARKSVKHYKSFKYWEVKLAIMICEKVSPVVGLFAQPKMFKKNFLLLFKIK